MSEPAKAPQRWLSPLEHDERVALIRANLRTDARYRKENVEEHAEHMAQDEWVQALTLDQLTTLTTKGLHFGFCMELLAWDEEPLSFERLIDLAVFMTVRDFLDCRHVHEYELSRKLASLWLDADGETAREGARVRRLVDTFRMDLAVMVERAIEDLKDAS